MNLKLREATQNDLGVLQQFEEKLLSQVQTLEPSIKQNGKLSYHDLPKVIESEETLILISEINGKDVGCGLATIKQNNQLFSAAQYGDIGFMYVDEEFQKQGVGKAIITKLLDWLRSKDINEAKLSVFANNKNAISFYESCGFRDYMLELKMKLD